jgi:hypothetical protein
MKDEARLIDPCVYFRRRRQENAVAFEKWKLSSYPTAKLCRSYEDRCLQPFLNGDCSELGYVPRLNIEAV